MLCWVRPSYKTEAEEMNTRNREDTLLSVSKLQSTSPPCCPPGAPGSGPPSPAAATSCWRSSPRWGTRPWRRRCPSRPRRCCCRPCRRWPGQRCGRVPAAGAGHRRSSGSGGCSPHSPPRSLIGDPSSSCSPRPAPLCQPTDGRWSRDQERNKE